MPKATGLAAEVSDKLGLEVELVKGHRGIFDVVADGEVVFSKYDKGRFPEHPEVLAALQALV